METLQPASATTPGSDSDALYGHTFAYVHRRYTLPGTHRFIRPGVMRMLGDGGYTWIRTLPGKHALIRPGVMRALGDGGYTRMRTLPGTHTSIRPGVMRALGDGRFARIRTETMHRSEDYIET